MNQETDVDFAQEQSEGDDLEDSDWEVSSSMEEGSNDTRSHPSSMELRDWLDESLNHPKISHILFNEFTAVIQGGRGEHELELGIEGDISNLQQGLQESLRRGQSAEAADNHSHNRFFSLLRCHCWRRGPAIALCFQPNDALSRIHKATVGYLMDDSLVYEVDLQTMMTYNVLRPSGKWDIPHHYKNVVANILEYVEKTVLDVSGFYKQIRDQCVVDNPSCFYLVDIFSCPLCSSPLRYCRRCSAQACSSSRCAAAALNGLQSCVEHSQETYCHNCLVGTGGFKTLGQCPLCGSWRCSFDVDWCSGVIPSGSDNQNSHQRSHPPRPGPCVECSSSTTAKRMMCANKGLQCFSWRVFRYRWPPSRAKHCPDCAAINSTSCRCGRAWFCGMCTKMGHLPGISSCSRCHNTYCDAHCQYLNFQHTSGELILCKDCIEEEDVAA